MRTLRDEDAAATLAGIEGGIVSRCMLPWVPLMRGGAEAGTIETWLRLARAEPDANFRADYGSLARTFAKLLPPEPARVWAETLKEWAMEKSPFLEEVRAQARQEWEKSLLEEIRAREEGKTLARGRDEGKLIAQRASVLDALRFRFQSSVPADLAAAIEASSNPDELDRWFAAVFAAPTLEEYRRTVGH
jgi:hypothetical protein